MPTRRRKARKRKSRSGWTSSPIFGSERIGYLDKGRRLTD